MKKIIQIALFSLSLLLIGGNLHAQRGSWGKSPQETATAQTKMMTDSLTLSKAQVKRIDAINLKYAQKRVDERNKMRENGEMDRTAMREVMQTMTAERNEELKMILTSEQYERHEKIEADRQANRRKRGEGRRGGKGKKGKKGKKDKGEQKT